MTEFNRRTLLKGMGVSMAFPWLETLAVAKKASAKKRFVAIDLCLGLHPNSFFPTGTGKNYKLSPYLNKLKAHRNDFTVFSGVSLPEVNGGHADFVSFLTGAPNPGTSSFKNSISLDQYAAAKLGNETRHSYLAMSTKSCTLSYSNTGIAIPTENSSVRLFKKLFLKGTAREISAQVKKLDHGKSILDTVDSQAKRLVKNVSKRDREKLDEYFTAVRETEKRIKKAETWVHQPKPNVKLNIKKDPEFGNIKSRVSDMYDLMHLAIETDQTRFMTFYIDGMNAVAPIKGVNAGYHNLSHHGKDPDKIKQLNLIEFELMSLLNTFLSKLKSSKENGNPLLDNTLVLFGSHLGNGSNHSSKNLPILLAGGKYNHGQHLAFDTKNNYPLSDLYVSILQGLGLNESKFSSGNKTMQGLQLS